MSNIPKNREHLLDLITGNYRKLWKLIENLDATQANLMVDDDFSIRDLIVIRVWWLQAVQSWIEKGQQRLSFALPAEGFNWQQTPALNRQIVAAQQSADLPEIREQLNQSNYALLRLIDGLNDIELTETGQFEWAGKWPVMRWISVGSSSQYDSAARQIRKALKRVDQRQDSVI